MASSLSVQKFRSTHKVEMWDHDPDSTSATVVTPDAGTTKRSFDMRDYAGFACAAMSSALTGAGITKLEIIASASSDLSSPEVVKDSGTVAADAVGDWVIEECTAEELAQLGAETSKALRYVAGRLTVANSADEAVVVYVGHMAKHEKLNLTPATTIA